MPKFVTALVLFAAALTACSPGYENNSNAPGRPGKKAVGVETKTGKTLIASEMCGTPVTDSAGKTTVATLRFQENAVFIRRSREMTNKSQFPVLSETKGTWGLLNEILFITENAKTVKHSFEMFERESDKAPCIRISTMENAPEFCACEI